MNSKLSRYLTVLSYFFLVLLISPAVLAKKPPKPPPEPEPVLGKACMTYDSFFPAFVYEFAEELFLSNAVGDCSIAIHKTDGGISGNPSNISYRFFRDPNSDDGFGRIVWSARDWNNKLAGFTRSQVFMLEFEVVDKEIVTPLPMTPRVLLVEPENFGNVYSPDLSPMGDRVIVSAYEEGELTGYIWEFEIPPSGQVALGDIDTLLTLHADLDAGFERGTVHTPLYGLIQNPQRIYFGRDYPDHKLYFIQMDDSQENNYSAPILIADVVEPNGLGPGGVGLWNYDGNGTKEVITKARDPGGIDRIEILDPEACANAIPAGSSDNCVIVSDLEGWRDSKFTVFAEGRLPKLLYLFDVERRHYGHSIRTCDLSLSSDTCYEDLYEAVRNRNWSYFGLDPAD